MQIRHGYFRAIIGGLLAVLATVTFAASPAAKPTASEQKLFQQTADKAVAYLQKSQNADGSYGAQKMPAIAAINTTGLLRLGRTLDDPIVAKGLKYLEANVQKDGGIYAPNSKLQNYETCLAIVCLSAANKDGRYATQLKNAHDFVKKIQWDGAQNIDEANFAYGGVGYGGKSRPDLSNTSMLMDALQASGAGPDDPHVKEALVFISRCQNLESEHNTTSFAAKFNDGGFYYSVADTKEADQGGGLRSYGSMSYAGLKSMLIAGLGPDDKRVKAATEWIKKNYDLKSNPGMGNAGLYYYYLTYAKAMEALGEDQITDAKGVKHDWRKELVAELASRQKADGSWVNENRQWLENDASVASGLAIMALSYCRAPEPEKADGKSDGKSKAGAPGSASPDAPSKAPSKTSSSSNTDTASPTSENTAQATPEQAAAFKKEVATFRKTLAKRDLPGAKKQIEELDKLAVTPDLQEAAERLDLLYQYYEGFWVAIGNAASSMKPTDEIVVNSSTRWIVVEAQPTSITLRGEGQSKRFTIDNMPAPVALTISKQWFDKDPKNKLFIGAFCAVEGSLPDAKKMWDEAAQAGVNAKSLLPLLTKELKDK